MMNEALTLWNGLGWPLCRLLFFVAVGILLGNFIEALNWTRQVARLASPLVRLGHLSQITGASFSMAFLSGIASNTMLAEAYDQETLSRRELVLANLFNSLPRYFLHLPTVFFLTAPLIGAAAFHYVGITLAAALFQTMAVIFLGRLLLNGPAAASPAVTGVTAAEVTTAQALDKAWQRFRKRFRRVLCFTAPVYILFYLLNRFGVFHAIQQFIAMHLVFLSWLKPQAMGVVVLHVTAEFTAGLAAAGVLLDQSSLSVRDVVLALMAGNVLSTPMRAVRHQFPYYAGIFRPRLAVALIVYSQGFRVVAIAMATSIYLVLM